MQMDELSSSIQQFVRQLVWIRAIYWRIDVKDIKQNSMLPADLFSSTSHQPNWVIVKSKP